MKIPRGFCSPTLVRCIRQKVGVEGETKIKSNMSNERLKVLSGGLPHPKLRLEESLLFPPRIPGGLHILRAVGVGEGADHI